MSRLIFFLLAVVTLWAYYPSLQHAPKHDQVAYLAEMSLRPHILERTVGAYSLNRDRIFMGRDEFLFRPLLNIFLGSERCLFGYNMTLWQAMGLLLHCAVGWSMFRLLYLVRPGISAAVAAGFFLLMLSNVPMVVWHNISAYMIFCVLVLESLIQLIRYQRDPNNRGALRTAVVLLFLAAFIFEAGILFILCAAFFVWRCGVWRKDFWILLGFGALALGINAVDFLCRHARLSAESARISAGMWSLKTLGNAFIALKWFLTTGLFLKSDEIVHLERVVVSPLTLDMTWPLTGFSPQLWRGVIAVMLFGAMSTYSFRYLKREKLQFLGYLLFQIACLIFFICVGRVNTRGILTGFFFNSYYIYFFWVLALPAFYASIDWDHIRARADGRWLRTAVYVLCGAFILINSLSIRNVNASIARVDMVRRGLIDSLDGFVREHRAEKDFTFSVSGYCPGDDPGEWLHRNSDTVQRKYALSEVLYPQYYKVADSKYRFVCPAQ
jgi:hypothetical protein